MFTGLLKYFPDALAAVARHSWANNEKHNPGEPLHWSKEKSNDHKDCIVRHMTDIAARPDDADFEIEELQACAWRALAALQIAIEAQQERRKTEWYGRSYAQQVEDAATAAAANGAKALDERPWNWYIGPQTDQPDDGRYRGVGIDTPSPSPYREVVTPSPTFGKVKHPHEQRGDRVRKDELGAFRDCHCSYCVDVRKAARAVFKGDVV